MAAMAPFVVLHIPHASIAIPEDLRPLILLSAQELELELLSMTDCYTDQLFALPPEEAAAIQFPVSRLILDPERVVDDAQESMAAHGMGVIYARGSRGQILREASSSEERSWLLARYYELHYRTLSETVDAAINTSGRCLVIDCHSFPSRPLPYELDQRLDRPDVCLGTDPVHTPDWLLETARKLFAGAEFRVALNWPYDGVLVPASHYHRDDRVWAIMIELNRSLYMDETAGERLLGFRLFESKIQSLLLGLLTAARSHLSDLSLSVGSNSH